MKMNRCRKRSDGFGIGFPARQATPTPSSPAQDDTSNSIYSSNSTTSPVFARRPKRLFAYVQARRWRQINAILANHAPEITQGYVLIEQFRGNNPFLAYAVINDGGAPGQRSGDGAYLPAQQ